LQHGSAIQEDRPVIGSLVAGLNLRGSDPQRLDHDERRRRCGLQYGSHNNSPSGITVTDGGSSDAGTIVPESGGGGGPVGSISGTVDYIKSNFGFNGYSCGLCQSSIPCESKIPLPKEG